MCSLRGHQQPGWAVQKLSTIQINLLRAPHCLDHPGGSGPEVCQGQPEADSELALSPVFPKVGCLLFVFPLYGVRAVELQVGQGCLSCVFLSGLWFKPSVNWKHFPAPPQRWQRGEIGRCTWSWWWKVNTRAARGVLQDPGPPQQLTGYSCSGGQAACVTAESPTGPVRVSHLVRTVARHGKKSRPSNWCHRDPRTSQDDINISGKSGVSPAADLTAAVWG